ncbi:MAG: hypothetical protein ACYDEY_15850 [Acidimicrobiales bacterium]
MVLERKGTSLGISTTTGVIHPFPYYSTTAVLRTSPSCPRCFDILTYRKAPLSREPESAFSSYQVSDAFAHTSCHLPSDRECASTTTNTSTTSPAVRSPGSTRGPATRPRSSPPCGHLEVTEVATTMFRRWREENLFRFIRPRGLDAMYSYAKVEDNLARMARTPPKHG